MRSLAAQAGPLVGSSLTVTITPSGVTRTQFTGPYTAIFTVKNVSTASISAITLSCTSSGSVSCVSVSPDFRSSLAAGASFPDTVTYNVGAWGVAGVTLHAVSDGGQSAQGTQGVTVSGPPFVTIIAPVVTSGSRAVVHNRQPIVRATLVPNASPIDTTKTVFLWRTDTVTTLARVNRGLAEWEVDSTHWLAIGDSALITLTACAQNLYCTTVTQWAVLLNDQKPVLGFTGTPLEALGRQFGAPFGPGLSVSGAEVETGFSIPGYVSMGASRGAGLVYSTRQSYPRALMPVDLELTWPTGNPDQIKLTLFDGAVKLDSLVLATPTCATGATRRCRAVLQGDFASSTFSTPTRKWLTVEARVTSGATTQIATDSGEVVLVDRRATMYGSGWWPAGVVKLVAAGSDRLLVGPSGAVAVYRGVGDSVYVAPPGDFTVLTKTASGWELSPRGSPAKLVFDSNGRLVKSLDQNGNRDSVAYSGSTDTVTKFIDPIGKPITLGYASGKLSTITDPGSRQSRVTINAANNQLTYDSISSPTARPATRRFTYQSYVSGLDTSVLLTTTIGVISDTTIVTYDSTFKRRPTQVRLPQVRDENNNLANPVIAYTAYERQGVGALVSLDSVFAQIKDPRNFWTRSLLNRWGEALKTWDSLGVIGKSTYTPDGLTLTTEGKTADSSRVYFTYDALEHLVRRYIVQDATHTLRLDSLVYDANHRVILRIDPQGRVSQLVYDGVGNVLQSIAPDSGGTKDTTWFWYHSNGVVDSTRLPGNAVARRFTYDTSNWWNLLNVKDESGIVVAVHAYDSFGRDTAPDTKVRATASPQQWQWRRLQTFYNVANQVDSVREVRTDNCAHPCNTPTWPGNLDIDSVHVQRVRHQFDRAGRDSLRKNDRNKATAYVYDRLGRLIRRVAWTSGTTRDSFAYDLAGNLRKTFTRRGDSITTNYDSRNRDTLSVIPGVGTLRKTYGGPLDQLTRAWYVTPVDSIGGVNAEVRLGYDQRGRLKADTTYTGAAARATSYTYDGFERPSTLTDPLGTWTTRYDTYRGFADSLLTPLGDTISYSFDKQARALGPNIKSGGNRQVVQPSWNPAGELTGLTHNVSAPVSYLPGNWQRAAFTDTSGKALVTLFYDKHGVDSTAVTLKDSVTYDGYERVNTWRDMRNGQDWEVEAYTYDRLDNIHTTAGAEVYDTLTSRLTSSVNGTYSYDAAGNLIQFVSGSVTMVYTYDALNQLRAVYRNGTLMARYGYDVLGRRIAKRVYSAASGGTVAYTRFVYHGSDVAYETDSSGAIGLRYTWGPGADNLIAVRDASGNHFYIVHDPLGSVRGVVKRDGTWAMSTWYSPFGAVSEGASSGAMGFTLRYGWTGREYDAELGWYYSRSRYYDPASRRFVQEDPIGYDGGKNIYAYVGGDVLESRDPSGMLARNMPPEIMCWSDACLGIHSPGPQLMLDGAELNSSWSKFVVSGIESGELVKTPNPIWIQGVFLTAKGKFRGVVSEDGKIGAEMITITAGGETTLVPRHVYLDIDLWDDQTLDDGSSPSMTYYGTITAYTFGGVLIMDHEAVYGVVWRNINAGNFQVWEPWMPWVNPPK